MSKSENNNSNSDSSSVMDVIVDVSLTALSLFIGSKYLLHLVGYKMTNSNIKKFKYAVEVPISDLRSLAQFSSSDKNNINPLVIVSGYIKPLSPDSHPPIVPQGASGKEAVFIDRVQISKFGTVRKIHQVPFGLVQKDSSDIVRVNMNGSQSKVKNYFTEVHSLAKDSSGVIQVEEKMLLLGEYFHAIGKVSMSKDGTPQINPVLGLLYFLSRNGLDDMKNDLLIGKSCFMKRQTIYGSIFACLLVYIIFVRKRARLDAYFQRFKQRRQARKQSKNNVDGEGEGEGSTAH